MATFYCCHIVLITRGWLWSTFCKVTPTFLLFSLVLLFLFFPYYYFFFHQHYKLGCGFGCNCIECVNLQHILYFANDIIFLIKIGFCLFTGMSLILATLKFHQTNILNLLLILLAIRFFGAIFSSKKIFLVSSFFHSYTICTMGLWPLGW